MNLQAVFGLLESWHDVTDTKTGPMSSGYRNWGGMLMIFAAQDWLKKPLGSAATATRVDVEWMEGIWIVRDDIVVSEEHDGNGRPVAVVFTYKDQSWVRIGSKSFTRGPRK